MVDFHAVHVAHVATRLRELQARLKVVTGAEHLRVQQSIRAVEFRAYQDGILITYAGV
jgi:hypothetical protein